MIWLVALAFGGTLDDPAFRFCHENRAFDYNEALCPLLKEVPPGTCPGLVEFCADPGAAPPVGCQSSGKRGEPVEGTSNEVEEPTVWDPPGCSLPDVSGGKILPWFIAFLVVFILTGIAIALMRHLGLRREPPKSVVHVLLGEEAEQHFRDVVDDVPDLPADDLLRAARTALDAGELGACAVLARGAVLRELGERGTIRLHRSRTDRQYVRQTQGEEREALDVVLTAAEQHRWGRVPLSTATVESVLRAAARLLSLGALLLSVTSAYGADRFGPIGDVALFRLVEEEGWEVRFHHGALDALDPEVEVLFVDTTALSVPKETWQKLLLWVEEGHLLIVVGEMDLFGPRRQVGADCTGVLEVQPVLPDGVMGYDKGFPLLDCEGAPVATVDYGEGGVIGIADPMLVWNGALMVPENEQFWREFFGFVGDTGWLEGPIEFATWGEGSVQNPPSSALANLAMLPFALHVLVLWMMVGWWKGARFVRPREGRGLGGRGFSEHLLALGSHYRRLAATEHVTRSYARWVLTSRAANSLLHDALRAGYPRERADALVERTQAVAAGERRDDALMEELWTLMRS